MTQDGIQFKMKRRQRTLTVSWEKVFGAAAMVGGNEEILIGAAKAALVEIKFQREDDDSESFASD